MVMKDECYVCYYLSSKLTAFVTKDFKTVREWIDERPGNRWYYVTEFK